MPAFVDDRTIEITNQTIITQSSEPMSVARAVPLLICSIGNPGSTYANTLHSAGHYIVQRLAEQLDAPQFTKEKQYGKGLMASVIGPQGAQWTLWQSTSYMNESGPGVKAAYRQWARDVEDGKLVVVYDELERDLGSVSLRSKPNLSARGHNGLKSIKAVIDDIPFSRIGVGIGRPASRESDDVARYVLRKMTPGEKLRMDQSIDSVIKTLKQAGKAG